MNSFVTDASIMSHLKIQTFIQRDRYVRHCFLATCCTDGCSETCSEVGVGRVDKMVGSLSATMHLLPFETRNAGAVTADKSIPRPA